VTAPKPLLRLGLRLLSESSAETHPAQIDPEAGKEDNGYQLAERAGLFVFQAPRKTIPDLEIEVPLAKFRAVPGGTALSSGFRFFASWPGDDASVNSRELKESL
jgi:hypothetical protein